MGVCSYLAIKVNTYVVFSIVIIWTVSLLLVPNEYNVECGCKSRSEWHCRFLTHLCMNKVLEVVPPSPSTLLTTHIFKGPSPPVPVNLTSLVMMDDTNENAEAPSPYFHLLFPLYMVFHLIVVLLQCWTLSDSPEVTFHIEKLHEFGTISDMRCNAISKWIETRCSRSQDGLNIFIRDVVGLGLVSVQLMMIQKYVDESKIGNLFDFLTALRTENLFMYNELPTIANCRFKGNVSETQLIFKESSQDVNLVCFLLSNNSNRILYSMFYAWTCLFLLILTCRVVTKILLVLFPSLRQAVLKSWTCHSRLNFSLKTMAEHVSPYEILFLMEVRSAPTVDGDIFSQFAQVFLIIAFDVLETRRFEHFYGL